MKKLFLFLVLVIGVVFASCSSTIEEAKTANVITNESETLEALKTYNAVLLKSCSQTRGGNRLFVASADIVGAIKSINAGKTIAGIVGAASGGIGYATIVVGVGLIGGAASSYLAYKSKTTCAYPAQIPDLLTYTTKIVNRKIVKEEKLDGMTARTDEDKCEDIPTEQGEEASDKINLPQQFNFLKRIGIEHNTILKAANVDKELPDANSVDVNDLEQVQLSEREMAQYEEAMNCQELKDYFYEAMEDVQNGSDIETLNCSAKVKQALQSYLDLFQTYPENVDELVEIANEYIRIIEANNEFSEEEKELIYSGIMVSVYSPQLWDNFK